MTAYKLKAIIAASISIIIIGAITIIALWPANTQSDDDESSPSDMGDGGVMNNSSTLNLVNLHYRVTNHTIITISTMVVVGLIILISIFAKGYASHKRRKQDKRPRKRSRERSNRSSRDYSHTMAKNGTWEAPRPSHMETSWMSRQYMPTQTWGHPGVQPQPHHPHQPHPGVQPQAAPRPPREDQPQGTEVALVHTTSRASNDENTRMANQWKPT